MFKWKQKSTVFAKPNQTEHFTALQRCLKQPTCYQDLKRFSVFVCKQTLTRCFKKLHSFNHLDFLKILSLDSRVTCSDVHECFFDTVFLLHRRVRGFVSSLFPYVGSLWVLHTVSVTWKQTINQPAQLPTCLVCTEKDGGVFGGSDPGGEQEAPKWKCVHLEKQRW